MSEQNTRPAEGDTDLARGAETSLKIGYKPFLSDFDPEKSEREKRKLKQRLYGYRNANRSSSLVYDEIGIYVPTGENLCDCLEAGCPGCHFPCSKCKSKKCGHECRSNRKWAYQSIEYEGTNVVVKNRHFHE